MECVSVRPFILHTHVDEIIPYMASATACAVSAAELTAVAVENAHGVPHSRWKGFMTSPSYGLAIPASVGRAPGILSATKKPKIPSIAKRPLFCGGAINERIC